MYLNVQGEEALEPFFSRVYIPARISFHSGEFVSESKVGGDAAGLSVGGDDMPFVAVIVGDFCEVVADFGKSQFCGDVVFARCWAQEVCPFLRGEFEEWSGCQEAEYESWQNGCSWIVSEFVGYCSG